MEVPVGFVANLWSFISFLPFFLLLFTLGLIKAAIIGPIVVTIILVGNTAVIIGLWPAHFLWTYYCVARSKRLGLVLKVVVLVLLAVPLVLWPILGIVLSLLGGIGYGIFAPLIATFEARGQNFTDKFYHCFADGSWSTIKGSCTVVRDLMDFCFHSYFSYMDELIGKIPADEKLIDIKLSKLPSCLLVCLIGVAVDVPLITVVALWKSPYMLFKGWKRLLEDLIGREGPFLEAVCVPFAGLAIILWPLAVVGAVLGAIVSSFFLGLYSGVVVHQQGSLCLGLAYVISVVSLFDEYVNDLLYLREGSCLPRPKYRRNMSSGSVKKNLGDNYANDSKNGREGSFTSKLVSERSRTLKWAIQQYKPMQARTRFQVWDWLFKSCEVNGRILIRDGVISLKDIGECILTADDVELTRSNAPKDKVFEWFIGPLLIMKEQIQALQLDENEESCLRELLMRCKNDKPEEWDDTCCPSTDTVRRAQLQAIIRRLQGLVEAISRIPTFRRRFMNLLKVLYLEALKASASANHMGGILVTINGNQCPIRKDDEDETQKTAARYSTDDTGGGVV
ncbi:Transmembrane protein [Parasponia andersonii]|uniref:Transmembrane protein n=1 Tax=Parasponia andersonii TaxID=3476 RepID=A0A2P5B638_PARAD|nr:Transmembrane protein [Parasponia andersonii]